MPQTYNITVRAGNSGTSANELGLVAEIYVGDEPVDLTGQEIVWRVVHGETQVLRKTTASGITISAGDGTTVPCKIMVPISVADSRTLQGSGGGLTHELERRLGDAQRAILFGSVFVEVGANDDA